MPHRKLPWIFLLVMVLLAGGLIWRSCSSDPEKTIAELIRQAAEDPPGSDTQLQLQAMGPEVTVEPLIAALEKIHEIPNFRPYSSESVNNFFKDAVYCGDLSKDVLEMYAKFYSSIVDSHVKSQQ